jgi:thiosulfate dehydrogenase
MGRLISAANFIHSNMPNGTTYDQPPLSVEEAWDVAAYVESMNRPQKGRSRQGFPGAIGKARRCRIWPYADDFSESQHKFGPFQPIRDKLSAIRKCRPQPGA